MFPQKRPFCPLYARKTGQNRKMRPQIFFSFIKISSSFLQNKSPAPEAIARGGRFKITKQASWLRNLCLSVFLHFVRLKLLRCAVAHAAVDLMLCQQASVDFLPLCHGNGGIVIKGLAKGSSALAGNSLIPPQLRLSQGLQSQALISLPFISSGWSAAKPFQNSLRLTLLPFLSKYWLSLRPPWSSYL